MHGLFRFFWGVVECYTVARVVVIHVLWLFQQKKVAIYYLFQQKKENIYKKFFQQKKKHKNILPLTEKERK